MVLLVVWFASDSPGAVTADECSLQLSVQNNTTSEWHMSLPSFVGWKINTDFHSMSADTI